MGFLDSFTNAMGNAATAASDWLSGAYKDASGQIDTRYDPYSTGVGSAYGDQLAAAAGAQNQTAFDSAAAGKAYGENLQQLAANYGGRLQLEAGGIRDAGANASADLTAQGAATQGALVGAGGQARGDLYGAGAKALATGQGWAGSQGVLADRLMQGPSVAEAQGRAAMADADAANASRIAGARGANTALMQRDAAQSAEAANRGLAADLGAAAAQERVARTQAAAGIYNQAGQTSLAGTQQNINAVNAGANANLGAIGQGYGANLSALGQAGQANLAGEQGYSQALGTAAGVDMSGRQQGAGIVMGGLAQQQQGQANASSTLGAGANAALTGEQINQQSHDNTNQTNADLTKTSVTNKSNFTGGLMKAAGAALMSDVRNKTAIKALSSWHPGAGAPNHEWDNFGETLAAAAGAREAKESAERAKVEAEAGKAAYEASKNAGQAPSPSLLALASSDGNREELSKVNPYAYRYNDDYAAKSGVDTEPRVGIMAQELERTPAGSETVIDTPNGKGIDYNRGLSYALAANAGLDKRVQQLEDQQGISDELDELNAEKAQEVESWKAGDFSTPGPTAEAARAASPYGDMFAQLDDLDAKKKREMASWAAGEY